jgi:hypothetical protein
MQVVADTKNSHRCPNNIQILFTEVTSTIILRNQCLSLFSQPLDPKLFLAFSNCSPQLRLKIIIDFTEVFTMIQQTLQFYSDLPRWPHKLKVCISSYNRVNSEWYITAILEPFFEQLKTERGIYIFSMILH